MGFLNEKNTKIGDENCIYTENKIDKFRRENRITLDLCVSVGYSRLVLVCMCGCAVEYTTDEEIQWKTDRNLHTQIH